MLNRLLAPKPIASARSVGSVAAHPAEPADRLGDVLSALTPRMIQTDYRQRLTRGEFTYPCWALHEAIRVLPMLGDKVRFWTASLKGLEWTIKTVPADKMPTGFDETKAEAQSEALRKAYEGLNVKEAISHLSRARFYGFSILAKPANKRLEPLDPWCFLRDGLYGAWYWNGELRAVRAPSTLSADSKIDPAQYIIREYEDPLILECLRIYLNALNVEQWWNLNLEQESKRQVVVLAGNLIDKEKEFQAVASGIARGGSGVLDKGSGDVQTEVVFPPASRGLPYYENRLRGLDEQLTKSMTGSMLTMLTAPGAGTLAGNAHADTLKTIILAEAAEISAVMQEQYDRGVLEGAGLLQRGEPALAYFELSARKEVDPGLEVQQTVALAQARYRRDVDELSERTGMTLTEEDRPEPQPNPFAPPPVPPKLEQPADEEDPAEVDEDEDDMVNRDPSVGVSEALGVPAAWLQPVADLLAEIEQKAADKTLGQADLLAFLDSAVIRMPELFADMDADALAEVLEKGLGGAVLDGLRDALRAQKGA